MFTSLNTDPEPTIIEDSYFKIIRLIDGLEVVPFGTSSMNFTRASYDAKGNYFDFDIANLEPGYTYGIKFAYFDTGQHYEQKEIFRFKVEKDE